MGSTRRDTQRTRYFADRTRGAFTIVELLIVVVVIAILAAITAVSYNGITNQANTAKLQVQYRSVANGVKLYQSQNGELPVCPSDPADPPGWVIGHGCPIKRMESALGLSGLPPGGYVALNGSQPGWAVNILMTDRKSYCKAGEDMRENWWTGSALCF